MRWTTAASQCQVYMVSGRIVTIAHCTQQASCDYRFGMAESHVLMYMPLEVM